MGSHTLRLGALLLTAALLTGACQATASPTPGGTATAPASSSEAGAPAPSDSGAAANPSEAPIAAPPKAVTDLIAGITPDAKQYPGVTVTVVVDGIQTGLPFFWYTPAIQKKFGITLKVVTAPIDTYYQSILNDIVSGTGSYDILNFPPRFLGDLASGGNLLDLDQFSGLGDTQEDDVFPVYRELYQKWDGHTVAFTYDGDHLELYYRKDLFDDPTEKANFKTQYGYDLGAPDTWAHYLDVAKFFTRPSGATLAGQTLSAPMYGMTEITRLPDNFDWFLNRFASAGGVYFDDQMHPGLDTPAGIQAMDNFEAAIKFGAPDILNFEYDETLSAYLQGQAAMVIQWTDVAKAAEDPGSSKIVGKTGYAQIPGDAQPDGTVVHRSTLAYSRIDAISKISKNAEAAYQVIKFMSSPDVSLTYVTEPLAGIDPSRESAYADPTKWVTQWPTISDYIANNKVSLTNAYPELTMPGAIRYDTSLGTHVARALAGQETSEEAMKATTSEWEAITDDLGRDNQITNWKNQLDLWRTLGLAK
jgi:multiple sugar transport system substrate-binding protein